MHYFLLTFPIFLGLLIWWFTAPDPRFVRSLFWLLPMMLAYILSQALAKIQWGRPRLNQAIIFVFVNLAVLATFVTYAGDVVKLPSGFTPTPIPELVSKRITRHLLVWTPVGGDRCWDVELPCTPNVNLQLRLRGSDLQHGFRVTTVVRDK